jgi:hypothetical protein
MTQEFAFPASSLVRLKLLACGPHSCALYLTVILLGSQQETTVVRYLCSQHFEQRETRTKSWCLSPVGPHLALASIPGA